MAPSRTRRWRSCCASSRVLRPFLTAHERYIAMLSYRADPALVKPYIPTEVELDLYGGEMFLSLVAFLSLETRLPLFSNLKQTNFERIDLRFNVRRKSADTWRRGISFVRRILPKAVASGMARAFPTEIASGSPLKSDIVDCDNTINVNYSWKCATKWRSLQMCAAGTPRAIPAGTFEDYLLERNWYFGEFRRGCSEYRVERPRWRVWEVSCANLDHDINKLFPEEFAQLLSRPPALQLLAEGSHVQLWRKADDPILIDAMLAARK